MVTHTTMRQEGAVESARSEVQESMKDLSYRVLCTLMDGSEVCSGQDYYGPVLFIYTALSMKVGMWHVGVPEAGQFMEPFTDFQQAVDAVTELYLQLSIQSEEPQQLALMEVGA